MQYIEEKNDKIEAELQTEKVEKDDLKKQLEQLEAKCKRLEQENDILVKMAQTQQNSKMQKKMEGSPSTRHESDSSEADSDSVRHQLEREKEKNEQVLRLLHQQLRILTGKNYGQVLTKNDSVRDFEEDQQRRERIRTLKTRTIKRLPAIGSPYQGLSEEMFQLPDKLNDQHARGGLSAFTNANLAAVTVSKARAVLEKHMTKATLLGASSTSPNADVRSYINQTLQGAWKCQVDKEGRITYLNTNTQEESLVHPSFLPNTREEESPSKASASKKKLKKSDAKLSVNEQGHPNSTEETPSSSGFSRLSLRQGLRRTKRDSIQIPNPNSETNSSKSQSNHVRSPSKTVSEGSRQNLSASQNYDEAEKSDKKKRTYLSKLLGK
eukprot:TRINITY_DN2390_c0_g1_i1.p1 TRINITY_DN2390_c0_g1~~TRINITY_DN2390_c0_g1_i1.p1  ORF type:complete len:381 (+),score=116.13 TRINITY_DN2390_c0_g1_i1:795-1937(+)